MLPALSTMPTMSNFSNGRERNFFAAMGSMSENWLKKALFSLLSGSS